MTHSIFVDGAAGTTGLRIHERLSTTKDIRLLSLPETQRKDPIARADMMAQADLTFLCLPDDAAREAVALAPSSARICDASTAHRTAADWVYGFPELSKQRTKITTADRVAIPGCHATGFIALMRPLIEHNALPNHHIAVCCSLTGYSGGGKNMIGEYTHANRATEYDAPRLYGLNLQHKHLPEMQTISGLIQPPLFTPIVADYYSGMLVNIPLPISALNTDFASIQTLTDLYVDYYQNAPLIHVHSTQHIPTNGMLAANALTGYDHLEIMVYGNNHQILLCAHFDNLGKGASGAAVQCMNLMLGREETAGLVC